jgi:hypothetical protein
VPARGSSPIAHKYQIRQQIVHAKPNLIVFDLVHTIDMMDTATTAETNFEVENFEGSSSASNATLA